MFVLWWCLLYVSCLVFWTSTQPWHSEDFICKLLNRSLGSPSHQPQCLPSSWRPFSLKIHTRKLPQTVLRCIPSSSAPRQNVRVNTVQACKSWWMQHCIQCQPCQLLMVPKVFSWAVLRLSSLTAWMWFHYVFVLIVKLQLSFWSRIFINLASNCYLSCY